MKVRVEKCSCNRKVRVKKCSISTKVHVKKCSKHLEVRVKKCNFAAQNMEGKPLQKATDSLRGKTSGQDLHSPRIWKQRVWARGLYQLWRQFREIQELHKGLSSLKYFCENAPEIHVAVAGSLLGVAMHQGESAPVGKVDINTLFPVPLHGTRLDEECSSVWSGRVFLNVVFLQPFYAFNNKKTK